MDPPWEEESLLLTNVVVVLLVIEEERLEHVVGFVFTGDLAHPAVNAHSKGVVGRCVHTRGGDGGSSLVGSVDGGGGVVEEELGGGDWDGRRGSVKRGEGVKEVWEGVEDGGCVCM